MTEPRRATDKLCYRAIITFIAVVMPIVVNIYTLGQYTGRMNARIDGLDKQVGTLQSLVLAHIAGASAMMRGNPQTDSGTTPQAPPPKGKLTPQGTNAQECHIPALITAKAPEVKR